MMSSEKEILKDLLENSGSALIEINGIPINIEKGEEGYRIPLELQVSRQYEVKGRREVKFDTFKDFYQNILSCEKWRIVR